MKIMVINPNSSKHMTEHLDEVLQAIKGPDTELTVCCPENGPMAIESAYDEAMCLPGLLPLVQQAEKDGYDAVILACFSDPGLEQARELVDILVCGIQEIAVHVAAMMGAKFSILTLNAERVPSKQKDIYRYKLERGLASVRPIGLSVAESDENPDLARARIKAVAKTCAEQDGAEVVVLGCAGMAGYAEDVKKELGLEVIDPSSVALKVVEALVACGIKPSKRGLYAYPPSFIREGKVKKAGCCG